MATSITMPQLGESVTEGTVGRWLKSVGEPVARDEPLVEIITDKVNVEVPSPADGVLLRISADEGQTVPVGNEIAVLGGPGERASVKTSQAPAEAKGAMESPPRAAETPLAVAAAAPTPEAPTSGESNGEHPRTSPLVRRLAREHGIELAHVTGTGLGGRVTREDILGYIERQGGHVGAATASAPAAVASAAPAAPSALLAPAAAPVRVAETTAAPAPRRGEQWMPLTPQRRAIAAHMVRSVSTAPHVTLCVEIDVTGVAKARAQAQAEFQRRESFELTYLPFVAKAVVEALREHPLLNSAYQENERGEPGVVVKSQINLGIAVALEDGLIVPVIHDADALSVAGLARAARDLATRARAARLSPEDVRGGTFTLNNTGVFGSVKSNSIINGGQAAILTMEAVVRRPVVVDRDGEEAIVVRSVMNSCLTFDHRVLDGLPAGRFMQSVKRRLEAFGPELAVY